MESDSVDVQEFQAEISRRKAEIQKLKVSNKRWMRIAGTEDLTGLPNKAFFSTALLPQQIRKAGGDGQFIGCLMVAPDGLGEINERYGRKGGGFIVKAISEFLKDNVEYDERLVHIDGANFVIMLPDADLQRVKRKGLALRAKITNRTFEFESNSLSLTVSMGAVARGPSAGGDGQANAKEITDTFLRKLGLTLDQAKHGGGNRVEMDEDTDF